MIGDSIAEVNDDTGKRNVGLGEVVGCLELGCGIFVVLLKGFD
jgi:hypothetical protein